MAIRCTAKADTEARTSTAILHLCLSQAYPFAQTESSVRAKALLTRLFLFSEPSRGREYSKHSTESLLNQCRGREAGILRQEREGSFKKHKKNQRHPLMQNDLPLKLMPKARFLYQKEPKDVEQNQQYAPRERYLDCLSETQKA